MRGAAEAIRALPGVAEVRAAALGGHWQRLQVVARGGAGDLREAIGRAIHRCGGTLRELRREAPTLEKLFVRLLEDAERERS